MKPLVLASLLVGICISSIAQGEETLVSHDVTYRMNVAKTSYLLLPQHYTKGAQVLALSPAERLARSDDIVDAILQHAAVDRTRIEFVRDRVLDLGKGKSSVIYIQRHQGYPIVGAGARVVLDENGQIVQASLKYETREFPDFRHFGLDDLRRIATRAVPSTSVREPVSSDMVIDPMGDGPAQLLYYAMFEVNSQGRQGAWRVCVDAVTGKVLSSESASKFVSDASPRRAAPGGVPFAANPAPTQTPTSLGKGRSAAPTPLMPIKREDDGGGGGGGGSPPTPITVYIDLSDCVTLEVDYTDGYGTVTAENFTYSANLSVWPGTSMTLRDQSSGTTCAKSLTLNYNAIPTLSYTFTPNDGDDVNFSADCSPIVRSEESTNSFCASQDLSTTRLFISDLPLGGTLSQPPILDVARSSARYDYLPIPCQAVQTPPASLTTLDNSRFDEVNAYHRADKFINNYLDPIGLDMNLGFHILTKVPESLSDDPETAFDPNLDVLGLGEGDAYAWGSYPGKHYYDAAKYASVIDHEISHAEILWLYQRRYAQPTSESQSVEEGICDFLAADFAGNPAIGVCYVKGYDNLRNCDNLPQDFNYMLRSICEYPVGVGDLAIPGSYHAQGMIVSGLLWDIRKALGPIAAEEILRTALNNVMYVPNFSQLGNAVLQAAQAYGADCQVRPLLIARKFPDILPGSAVTPTGLTVSTPNLADRCHIHAAWSGSGSSYNVTWTPDGAGEQSLGSVTTTAFDGSVGTAGGGTVNVYAVFCGQTSTPASARREAVTTNVASSGIQATNQPDGQGGTQTLVSWNAVANALNYQVTRSGVPIGGVLPASQTSYVDPAGCAGTFSYCVNVVDCAGPQTGGPCVSDTRPGTPLSVTVTGPASLHASTSGTFTAHVTGGCGIYRVFWWWEIECTNKLNSPNIEECDRWYSVDTTPSTSFTRGFAFTNFADVKVEIMDLNGADVTSAPFQVPIITPGPSLVAGGGEAQASSERQEGPAKLVCDGRSIALANSGSGGAGVVTLQLFDIAGRRLAQMASPTGEGSRIEFPAVAELSSGVYFARALLPNGTQIRRMVVLKR